MTRSVMSRIVCKVKDLVTGLTVPSVMTSGPDGDLYVSDFGAAPSGAAEVVQIPLIRSSS
jgi:hypothetical protein